MSEPRTTLPRLGLGLGLRNVHFETILSDWPVVGWFEAISENFMDSGGRPRAILRQVADRYPVVLHGVSLSIGSCDPLNLSYLDRLKTLADEIAAPWVSDHLCWTGINGLNSHDLLPLPLTEESLRHVTARVHHVQDVLGRPLILENPSTYIRFAHSTIDEQDYLRALVAATGCGVLLDVNNVFVSCWNAGADPVAWLERFPFEAVVQMHLAGHQQHQDHLIDTHDHPVRPEVWELFRIAWARTGGASICLEWDDHIPDFAECLAELHKAEAYMADGDGSAATGDAQPARDGLAHPADFLIPRIMDSVAEAAA
jgi:uncharacterized protein